MILVLSILSGIFSCSSGVDTLWQVLWSGETLSGCRTIPGDSLAATRKEGESVAQFLRRAGNALVEAGLPAQGLDKLSRARTSGGPQDSLLAEIAEALLAMGRLEQAVAATYALEGSPPSVVLLRQRAKVFALAGLEEESRQALEQAESLAPRPSEEWKLDRRPNLFAVLSGRDDREERSVDPAFARRATLQSGFLPGGTITDPNRGDTSVFLGRSVSQNIQMDWGLGNPSWRFEASLSAWSVTLLTHPEELPWGVSGGLSLRRRWNSAWWTRSSLSWQRNWRDGTEDDVDGGVSTGWAHGPFSAAISHREMLAVEPERIPSRSTNLSMGWSPKRGPRWSASGGMAWKGGQDANYSIEVPATTWRTRGVAEGLRLWRDDRHPPSWTLLDPVSGASFDSAQMVRFGLGLSRVPESAPQDIVLQERRPSAYWTPSLSLGLTQDLPWKFRANLVAGHGWRMWSDPMTVLLADPWTPLLASGSLVVARDEETGQRFLVTDPKGGTFIPLDETRRRRDHWTTLSFTLSWTPLPWTSWQIGWRATQTETNIADIDSTVATTRSTWSLDGSVWW